MAPEGKGKYTVQNKIQETAQQSSNVIIDLRRSKMLEEKAVKAYEWEFRKSKGLRRGKALKRTCPFVVKMVQIHFIIILKKHNTF